MVEHWVTSRTYSVVTNTVTASCRNYKCLLEIEKRLQSEVEELFALEHQTEQAELPDGLDIATEITFRRGQLISLSQAKAVLEARAEERYQAELAEREEKAKRPNT